MATGNLHISLKVIDELSGVRLLYSKALSLDADKNVIQHDYLFCPALLKSRQIFDNRVVKQSRFKVWQPRKARRGGYKRPPKKIPLFVSTVLLSCDLGFGGRPRYFETMVFVEGKTGTSPLNNTCERYATYAEAVAGHAAILKQLNKLHIKR